MPAQELFKQERQMNKRSTRFYRKNEADVMQRLGFRPTKNSGAGWIEKEDGENDLAICQLKSTDKQSISIKQSDIRMLEYHASVSHKVPVFAIQFLNTGEVWLMAKPEDIEFKKIEQNFDFLVDNIEEMEYNKTINKEVQEKDIQKAIQARKLYEEQKQKEREAKEEEYKERRKEQRRRSYNKKGLQSSTD